MLFIIVIDNTDLWISWNQFDFWMKNSEVFSISFYFITSKVIKNDSGNT